MIPMTKWTKAGIFFRENCPETVAAMRRDGLTEEQIKAVVHFLVHTLSVLEFYEFYDDTKH